jgi:hypothetical protein
MKMKKQISINAIIRMIEKRYEIKRHENFDFYEMRNDIIDYISMYENNDDCNFTFENQILTLTIDDDHYDFIDDIIVDVVDDYARNMINNLKIDIIKLFDMMQFKQKFIDEMKQYF